MVSTSAFARLPFETTPSTVRIAPSASGLCVPMVAYAFGTLPAAFLMAAKRAAAAPVAASGAMVVRRDMIDSLDVWVHLLAMWNGMGVSVERLRELFNATVEQFYAQTAHIEGNGAGAWRALMRRDRGRYRGTE